MDYKLIGTVYAPIEYDGPDMLALFGISKIDLVPYFVGTKKILIYPCPADEVFSRIKLQELREKYTKRSRDDRCLVPGKSGRLIVCPEKNRCEECPFKDSKIPRVISMDAFQEAGGDLEARGTDMLGDLLTNEFLEYVQQVKPECYPVLDMKLEGFSVAEISRELELPYHVIRYRLDQVRVLATEFFKEIDV